MMHRSNCDFPRCEKFECANNEKNNCVALITTDFKGKPCPFYKTRGQARKEKLAAMERNGAKTAREKAEFTKLTKEVADNGEA